MEMITKLLPFLPPDIAAVLVIFLVVLALIFLPLTFIYKGLKGAMELYSAHIDSLERQVENGAKENKETSQKLAAQIDLSAKEQKVTNKKIDALIELYKLGGCDNAPTCLNRRAPVLPSFGQYCYDCEEESCFSCPYSVGFNGRRKKDK